MNKSDEAYRAILKDKLKAQTGISADNLISCKCGDSKKDFESFVMVAHNAKAV